MVFVISKVALFVVAVGFIFSITLFLVTSNVRLVIESPAFYQFGFERYNVALSTGLSMEQLMMISDDIRDYFHSDELLLDVRVSVGGQERSLFNDREILHMRDVKRIISGLFMMNGVSALYLTSCLFLLFISHRHDKFRILVNGLLAGSVLTIALMVLGGLSLIMFFDTVFQQFHVLIFPSGTWTFDPLYNYLTRMFTEGFFMDAGVLVAVLVLGQALATFIVCWTIKRRLAGAQTSS